MLKLRPPPLPQRLVVSRGELFSTRASSEVAQITIVSAVMIYLMDG